MTENVDETIVEQETVVEDDSLSLKEKIKQINFVKWGKRVAVATVILIVAGVAIAVTKDKTETEED